MIWQYTIIQSLKQWAYTTVHKLPVPSDACGFLKSLSSQKYWCAQWLEQVCEKWQHLANHYTAVWKINFPRWKNWICIGTRQPFCFCVCLFICRKEWDMYFLCVLQKYMETMETALYSLSLSYLTTDRRAPELASWVPGVPLIAPQWPL